MQKAIPRTTRVLALAWLGACTPALAQKTITVTADDTVITESCKVVIPPGTVIADANGDGVLHIKADNIVVEFTAGSALRGAPEGTPWDQLRGVGIRLDGRRGVALWKVAVHGFKVGIHATGADGLEISEANLSDNFRQRLKSTPWAEDGSDWLWPHKNDNREWVTNYGAALCIERSVKPVIRKVTVRRGQNGIILDRVTEAMLFENDCCFLTGWGLAMWRSSNNRIMRNRFDFCVRGYSHGVYNRGQDSAGILCFEQCSKNVFAENSATHGGDGFFGFAGMEAIGEVPPTEPGFDYVRKGCNDNLFIDNDFSFAAAHGIEMTFSHGNLYWRNKLIEDAICGIWAGYSNDSIIAGNQFERNGQAAYGLERGGVNIEHGSGNKILQNNFHENVCAVHLWWDNDQGLLEKPGVKANHRGVTGNIVANNAFHGDRLVLQIRDDGGGHVKDTLYVGNRANNVAVEIDAPAGAQPVREGAVPQLNAPPMGQMAGAKQPLRGKAFHGRDKIVMTEWGPWDVQTTMVRLEARGPSHTYGVYVTPRDLTYDFTGPGLTCGAASPPRPGVLSMFEVKADAPGVYAYSLRFKSATFNEAVSGTVIRPGWSVTIFPWTREGSDPEKVLDAWRGLAKSPQAVTTTTDSLSIRFGGRARSDAAIEEAMTKAGLKRDFFGIVARTRLDLPKGRWHVTTRSDDGVRVTVNDKPVLENWTRHGETRNEGVITMDQDGSAEIVVEYFAADGPAVLECEIEPAA